MAVTSGFFNSVNSDRLYNADQVNNFFEGLVSAGVFESVGGALAVTSGTGMQVQVDAGKASDSVGRWAKNDSVLNLEIDAADVTLNRWDAVIVKFDSNTAVRSGTIEVKKGAIASTPAKPTMIRNEYIEEYCLAYVYVAAGTTAIAQSMIQDTRMNNEVCGLVVGLIEQVDTTTLFTQWTDAFDTWFADVKETLKASTLIRSYENTYTTTIQDETIIPIGISQFNMNLDIINAYINGLKLIPNAEYRLDSNTQITLTNGVDAGTPISFEVFKSVDGSDAETVVQQVYQLQLDVDLLKASDPNIKKVTVSLKQGESTTIPVGVAEQNVSVTWDTVTSGTTFYNMATTTETFPWTTGTGYVNIGSTLWSQLGNDASSLTNNKYFGAIHISNVPEGASVTVNSTYFRNKNGAEISSIEEPGWYYFGGFYNASTSNTNPAFRVAGSGVTIDYCYATTGEWLYENYPDYGLFNATTEISAFATLFPELPIVPTNEYFTYTNGTDEAACTVNITQYNQDNSEIIISENAVITAVLGGVSFSVFIPNGTDVTVEKKLWGGVKIAFIGDSLTDSTINATVKYHKLIADATGATVQVLAQGGTGWWCGYDTSTSFGFKVPQIEPDTDIVTFLGSVNDWKYYQESMEIGTATDTLADGTLCGYINDVFDKTIEAAPLALIKVFSSMYYYGVNETYHKNVYNALKSVCEYRGIPFIDMFYDTGFMRIKNATFAQEYTTDYSASGSSYGHPSNTAHRKIIAPIVFEELKKMVLTV